MADETADVYNLEQLVICIRWIDSHLEVHEDFVGLTPLERTTADSVTAAILVRQLYSCGILLQTRLKGCIRMCLNQQNNTYGALNMS